VGFYARPAFDDNHNESGFAHVVIIDLKSPGVRLGSKEKEQTWKYIKELRRDGYITDYTRVNAFILGSEMEEGEQHERKEGEYRITPLHYETVLKRAEKRMLNLLEKIKTAPFLVQQGIEIEKLLHGEDLRQSEIPA
jgi:hypothetical protein